MKVSGFIKCWDLNRFLLGSLKKNCNDFKTKTRKVDGYDHIYIQNKFNQLGEDRFIEFIKNDKDAFEYLRCDVQCLRELTEEFVKVINNFANVSNLSINIFKYLTISAFTYSVNKEMLKIKNENLEILAFEQEVTKSVHDYI